MKKGTLEWMNYAERDFEAAKDTQSPYFNPSGTQTSTVVTSIYIENQ